MTDHQNDKSSATASRNTNREVNQFVSLKGIFEFLRKWGLISIAGILTAILGLIVYVAVERPQLQLENNTLSVEKKELGAQLELRDSIIHKWNDSIKSLEQKIRLASLTYNTLYDSYKEALATVSTGWGDSEVKKSVQQRQETMRQTEFKKLCDIKNSNLKSFTPSPTSSGE